MSEPQTWRELLGQCLTSGQEKERIASLVGVNPLTLTRWVNDEAKPRLSNIHRLLDALPKYRSQFLELLPDDLKPIFDEAKDLDGAHEIPTPFYTSVLNAFTTTAPALRFRAICDLILLQALQQLDPNRVGYQFGDLRYGREGVNFQRIHRQAHPKMLFQVKHQMDLRRGVQDAGRMGGQYPGPDRQRAHPDAGIHVCPQRRAASGNSKCRQRGYSSPHQTDAGHPG